jgi:hypothetical protein
MPCRSLVEVLLSASEKLEVKIAPQNWLDAAAVFVKTNVCSTRIYSLSLCSDPEFLWISNCSYESPNEKSDTVPKRVSNADS